MSTPYDVSDDPSLPYGTTPSLMQSQTNLTTNDDDLSEAQLREIYDNEEIERFINIFSAFVTEVEVLDSPGTEQPTAIAKTSSSTTLDSQEGDWTAPKTSGEFNEALRANGGSAASYGSLSEEIAMKLVLPRLPRARPPAPPFSISRLRMTMQRLYLVIIPSYGPFLLDILSLALWDDMSSSLIYCTIYWTLWWYDLLPAALILRVLFAVMRRRVLPYPSLDELRRHRREISEASEFGAQISAKWASSNSSGMKDMWKLVRLLDQTRKRKFKFSNTKANHTPKSSVDDAAKEKQDDSTGSPAPLGLDDAQDAELQHLALNFLNEIADAHERVKNLLIWRRPRVSTQYATLLVGLLFVTLLPAKYMLKIIFLGLGFLFWHVAPVLAALPAADRRRIPSPLGDVPTDAEYAMELISHRVEAGLDIRPRTQQKINKKRESTESILSVDTPTTTSNHFSRLSGDSIDWKKWGGKLSMGKSIANSGKRLFTGKPATLDQAWPPPHPMMFGVLGIAQPQTAGESHTFTSQHSSGPGVITLTPRLFFFTPLMSLDAKIMIPMKAVKGVKKAGLFKGLNLRWSDDSSGIPEIKEEKFMWISDRDELFARLVGADGRRWVKV